MSRVVRSKHVQREMMEDDFELPSEHQYIVRVVSSRGNNLHEVENPAADSRFLVSMPTKFRKNVWVKRGDYLLVEPIVEGDKVKAEICKILTPAHVKEYTKAGIWPKEFTKKRGLEDDIMDTNNDSTEGFVVRNMNRPAVQQISETDESDETDDD